MHSLPDTPILLTIWVKKTGEGFFAPSSFEVKRCEKYRRMSTRSSALPMSSASEYPALEATQHMYFS